MHGHGLPALALSYGQERFSCTAQSPDRKASGPAMRPPFNPKLRATATLCDGQTLQVKGRAAQTLQALYEAGSRGVNLAQMSNWALRLASYVYDLRGLGLCIVTERVKFEGGYYGQYILKTPIKALDVYTPPPEIKAAQQTKPATAATVRASKSNSNSCKNEGLDNAKL